MGIFENLDLLDIFDEIRGKISGMWSFDIVRNVNV